MGGAVWTRLRLVDLDVIPGAGAQSPTPTAGTAAALANSFGGMATTGVVAGQADGLGGPGASLLSGATGFGMGSFTGAAISTAKSGLAGEGGGHVGGISLLELSTNKPAKGSTVARLQLEPVAVALHPQPWALTPYMPALAAVRWISHMC